MSAPNPGSSAAIDAGCSCAVMDNNHGAGFGTPPSFWISGDCTLHAASNAGRLLGALAKDRVRGDATYYRRLQLKSAKKRQANRLEKGRAKTS